jgi:peptidoglycan/xylan/chitin deacetylase (PgdA/CDA1 family)
MSRLELKRKIGKIWPIQPYGRKIILLYHSVGNNLWSTREHHFLDQMNWLSDHCHVLSLMDVVSSRLSNEIQVALTFDDGYQTLYDQVAPILTKKKINGTVYVNTGWISEEKNSRKKSVAELGHYPDESFLTWQEVKELHAAGWEIGSHGVNHYNFAEMQDLILQQELFQSKYDIEQHVKISCLHFSYPWGRYSSNVKKAVKEAGYQYAVAARHMQINSNSDLLALPRINIEKDYSFEDFKNIIKGKWDYLSLVHKLKGL